MLVDEERVLLSDVQKTIDDLSRLGLFKYSSDDFDFAEFIAQDEITGLFEFTYEGRSFDLDAEELAEGSIDRYFLDVRDVLRANGAGFDSVSLDYSVEVEETLLELDGVRYVVGQEHATIDGVHRSWLAYTMSFFSIINERLRQSGSRENAYAICPYTNSQMCVFLTPELHAYVLRHGLCRSLTLIEFPAPIRVPPMHR